jgi:hypothetical protein
MRLFNFRNAVFASAIGFMALAGADVANAQSQREYRDWQRAQQRAERERMEYMRTRSQRDYREWQRARREAQREMRDFRSEAREDRRDRARMYRVYRNGSYYSVDARGAELLRQAVNSGYQQGYNQGMSDRRYGRNSGYYRNNVYQMGTYGYQSYVDRNQYQYYFQQGFQRGYEDGFNSQFRYGYRSGNSFNILGGVLSSILNLIDQ